MVTIRFFAAAAAVAGMDLKTVAVDDTEAVLSQVVLQAASAQGVNIDKMKRVLEQCSFLVDGHYRSSASPVGQAQIIDVLPPFAGG